MHPQIFSTVVTRRSVDMRRFARAAAVAAAGVIAVTGCAPQLQTQIVGRTTGRGGTAGLAAAAVAAEIPVPESPSAQVLRYVVALPRAVQLHYQVTCPTARARRDAGRDVRRATARAGWRSWNASGRRRRT